MRTGRATLLLIVITLAIAVTRLQAQQVPTAQWNLEGGLGGYCIWYLADPDLAKQMVPVQTVLTPAGTGDGLPPLLARTVQDEPRFATWIPGAICIGFYTRIASAGQTLAHSRPDRPVILATSSLASVGARGVAGSDRYLLDFMTSERGVERAASALGLDMNSIQMATKASNEGGDPSVSIDVDGVTINWSGHAFGDSSVGKTRTMSFGYTGSKGSRWLLRLEETPGSTRLMAGALQVIGGNTLAKALKASPVRGIGPENGGASGSLTFQEATRP